jgi:hypothetical protein
VILDTTVAALVAPGAADSMLLALRGDTVDSRVIVRFDSLPQRFRPSATDTTTQPITTVTRSALRLFLSTKGGKLAELYELGAPIVERTDTAEGVVVVAHLPNRELVRFAEDVDVTRLASHLLAVDDRERGLRGQGVREPGWWSRSRFHVDE